MFDLKGGLAAAVIIPQSRSFQGQRYKPGTGLRTTASMGYMWMSGIKLTLGLNREQRQALRIDGQEQANTDQLVHSAFVNTDWQVTPQDNVRLGWSRQAAAFQNRNTSRSTSLSVAVMDTARRWPGLRRNDVLPKPDAGWPQRPSRQQRHPPGRVLCLMVRRMCAPPQISGARGYHRRCHVRRTSCGGEGHSITWRQSGMLHGCWTRRDVWHQRPAGASRH